MVSTRENAANVAQDSNSLADRLRGFMRTHNLSLEELAELLRIPPQTLDHWFHDGVTPPPCLLALMVFLGTLPQARCGLGLRLKTAESRGSPFRHGDGFGLNHRDHEEALNHEEALRRVRAI
jgi:hypothetical protein